MPRSRPLQDKAFAILLGAATLLVLATIQVVFLKTPIEAQMGIIQKVFYFHVPAAYAISGLFELTPLIPTSVNEKLALDEAEAEALSPLSWPAPEGKSLDAVVGGAESSEYLRQSASIVAAWGEDGVATRYEEIPGANHFTAIDPLTVPNSPMCERLKQLVARA